MTNMTDIKVGDLIQSDAHPERGTWGVSRDCGDHWEILGDRGSIVLFKPGTGWTKVST